MASFEKLFNELQEKSSLDKDSLLKKIKEKKKKVGAGYLTDSGALFLVASDLGISLEPVASSDLTLRDLHIGANEITIVARILALYPLKTYKKKDESQGFYRRMIIFDGNGYAKVTFWDDKAETVGALEIKPDMVVRISKGYVRSDLDSRAVLHVGTKGDIEIITDKKVIEKIPDINKVTKALAEIKSPEMFLAVKGQVGSTPRFSQFTRKNGSQGSVTQLHLADVEDGKEKRVVIWDNESEDILSLKPGSVIRLVNVRAKLVQQGELELHGDTGTYIELISTDFEKKQISVSMPETYRLLSIGPEKKGANEVTSTSALIVDASGNFYTLIARGSAYEKLLTISKDSLITCTPDRVFDSRLFCENEKTINLHAKEDDSFLDSESLFVKIEQISKKEIPTFVVVIALSRTSLMDIVTKDGSTVKKAELLVGDETGEINLIAWRDLTKMIDDVSPGEKMRIIGAVPQESGFSELGLLIKSYSSIEKLQAK